jgi:virginiamycin A acetyltransferase
MDNLKEFYQVTKYDIILCKVIKTYYCGHKIRFIFKKSQHKYGRRDNLARYYCHKYLNITVGKYSYGYEQLCYRNSPLASIGSFCSIAKNVKFITGQHPTNYISTSPALYLKKFGICLTDNKEVFANFKPKKIIIGNDVWIGQNVTILSAVTIGNGAIIGTGAIVAKDVPDYAVVVGNPAKIIRYRFNPDEINILQKLAWWDWDDEKIKNNINKFFNVKEFLHIVD